MKDMRPCQVGANWPSKPYASGGGTGGGGLELVPFSPIIIMTGNFKSFHVQTGEIAYSRTNNSPQTNFGNRTVHYIEPNGSGKPTFSANFTVQYDNWSNTIGALNMITHIISPDGSVLVWLERVK
jgi:hypothetical protein